MMFSELDAQVQSAIIQAVATVLSSVMAALVGGYFAFKWLNQQHLKEKLLTATQDISFLLEVERLYIENSRINGKVTSVGKYKIRAQARRNGYKWSGMFTPGRVSSTSVM